MFESAGRGTIFLDELGEMSLSMQVRLLHVLQEHKVRPVGSKIRKRLTSMRAYWWPRIAISGERLRREGFRQDLYYRVNVLPTTSPSLRDRRFAFCLEVKREPFMPKPKTSI